VVVAVDGWGWQWMGGSGWVGVDGWQKGSGKMVVAVAKW
jgi:hypothetical protein